MGKPDLNKQLHRAARKGDVDEIARLLDAGANIESRGGFLSLGQTPLGAAVSYKHKEAVNYLIARGADINRADDAGDTPLFLAVSGKNSEIAKILLAHGADPRKANDRSESRSPLEMARHLGDHDLAEAISGAIFRWRLREQKEADEKARKKKEREEREKEAERSKDVNIVMVFTPVGDRTLQEIYNFATLDRLTLVRKADDGPVEAMTRQEFADIGDKPALRKAFAEHVKRGGKTAEKDVFPNSLQIIKSLPKDAP